jgi:hypothetical protein
MNDDSGPKRKCTYPVRIVYAIGVYDSGSLNPTVLDVKFDEVEDWWLYETLVNFLGPPEVGGAMPCELREAGKVYEFNGTWLDGVLEGDVRCRFDASHPTALAPDTATHVRWEVEEDTVSVEHTFSMPTEAVR